MPLYKYVAMDYGKYSRKLVMVELLIFFFFSLSIFLASGHSEYRGRPNGSIKQEGKNPIPVYVISPCERKVCQSIG